jgi:quercetin dioxygenase-like cupin family protein
LEKNTSAAADKGKDKKKDTQKYIPHHTIKIEKWNWGIDGKCTTDNMQKKFRMQAYSCGVYIVIPGKGLPDHNTGEIRRIGLVDGSLVAELYGKRIRLHPGDIIELPAGQRNCGDAEGEESATIIFGTKQGCLIS